MMYQLHTGKTIIIDVISSLDMTDIDYQNLVADDRGVEINNPFFNTSIDRRKKRLCETDETESDLSEALIGFIDEIPDISDIEEIDLDKDITDQD